jgi:uncharacterized lipoprotein YajG
MKQKHYQTLCSSILVSLISLTAAGFLLTACAFRQGTAPAADITGTYALVSVNGKPLPASVAHGKDPLEVRSGNLTINSDGTCASTIVFVPPSGKEVTRNVTATYTREGSTLNMQWKGAGQTTGTVQGNTFTMHNEGMLFAYRK